MSMIAEKTEKYVKHISFKAPCDCLKEKSKHAEGGQDSQKVQKLPLSALHKIRSSGKDQCRIPHLVDISLGG